MVFNATPEQRKKSPSSKQPDLEAGRKAGAHAEDEALEEEGSVTSSTFGSRFRSTWLVTIVILVLGSATSAAFLALGISAAFKDQNENFERSGQDLVNKIQAAWEDYVNAAAMIHMRCRSRNFTREDFREMYEYLVDGGLHFQAAQFDPKILHEEREYWENEAREYYAKYYPHIEYRGIIGFNTETSKTLEPRWVDDEYWPIHFMEPIPGNEAAIDLDYHASGSRRRTVHYCLDNGKPALTDRLVLVQETEGVGSYGVVLMHPGTNLTTQHDVWPRDLASIVIRIPDLLRRSTENQGESSSVYIHDASDSRGGEPLFLGGVRVEHRKGMNAELTFQPEIDLEHLTTSKRSFQQNVVAANKNWTVTVVALDGTFEPELLFVILGGCIIFVASICLAMWVYTNTKRVAQFNIMKAEAEAEKQSLILESAKQAAQAERELNDFIAHEVRNPVAAAMSACSFVKSALSKDNPLPDVETRASIEEDVYIIDNSLRFVNDLLRNMLDMHRAANKHLKVNMTPTDILHDVLEPVDAMLIQKASRVKVIVECPKNLIVMTDRLRAKQIILNLARNSVKFIDEGFIKLRAEVMDGFVQLSVEDSGPGIPEEKQERLFCKFQESLDMLSQGTGIGLFLCKNLTELMGGEIWLDKDYDSGVPGCPGARFVVNLKFPPIDTSKEDLEKYQVDGESGGTGTTILSDGDTDLSLVPELPTELSVLFVDDDPILRKLFARTVKTVAPTWTFREASNGETALRLVETEHFDLIFVDMYMASVEKQLLGTETVEALRSRGIKCRICGLSANDKETEFLEAGADTFTFKPFPCEARALTQELCRILFTDEGSSHPE